MERPVHPLRFLFSRDDGPDNRFAARWLFLRALGGVYFSAFLALLFQARGLIGSGGVLPFQQYLDQQRDFHALRFWQTPSLLWLHPTDGALMTLMALGLFASVAVMLNLWPRISLWVCFLCFLSFVAVSQDFGQYQSDGMLLEAGFLSLFVAPGGLRPGFGVKSRPVRAALWLLLFEWFRIYFQSGVVKLASGDPTWRNLTAMYEYYQNGPLPTWIGWYLQHLPHWFHIATAAGTLFMELVIVWMAFLPRRWRIVCFWIVTVWQAGVILTANYAFLNYLVLILGFLLLDDAYLRRFVPARWRGELPTPPADSTLLHEDAPTPARRRPPIGTAVSTVFLLWVGYATVIEFLGTAGTRLPLPETPAALLEPFRIANSYGLFAVMTPHRYEIEFEGSDDGQTWKPYQFRFKPQDVHERPGIYAPYQPRFDWNLWFASLGPWEQAPIVPLTEARLLNGSPAVLGLFRSSPFPPDQPPHYVRAVLYQYWFSTWAEHRDQGLWWRRERLGTYAPTLEKLPDGTFGEVAAPELSEPPDETP